ncbi:MAG: carboxymuconolactone decarboxylase family protein [Agriterribacter sp.]
MRTIKLFIAFAIALGIAPFSLNAQSDPERKITLSRKEQGIIRIAAITAKGDLTKLKTELNTGLDAGLTVNQIKEVLVHLYAYAGFPRSLRGLQTFMAVLDERKAGGINDVTGAEASPVNDNRSKYERGKAILEKLTGVPEKELKTGYAAFAPEIEVFLKEHLFADIFERDILIYAEREWVTVSVLSSIGGVEPMLQSHFKICLNVGITAAQLHQFIGIIKTTVGKKEAMTALKVLNEVLKNQQVKSEK